MAHAPICGVKKCPEKTVVRFSDGTQRKDMCLLHGIRTRFHYQNFPEVTWKALDVVLETKDPKTAEVYRIQITEEEFEKNYQLFLEGLRYISDDDEDDEDD